MKNSFLSCLLVLSLVLAGAAGPLAADGIHSTTFDCHDPQHPNQSTSGPGVKIIERSRAMPNLPDFRGLNQADELNSLQCIFDVFSWQSFIALNFAEDHSFGAPAEPAVWESWPVSTDIFLADGADPGPWAEITARRNVPTACRSLATSHPAAVFSQMGKRDFLRATNEPFESGPLVATNGYYTRYTISVNQDMYNYLHRHQLYSKAGQMRFANAGHKVEFPCGCNSSPCAAGGQAGAVMVKAAWKVILPSEDQSTFHTADALVYTPEQGTQTATCVRRTMGLVGFHIGHKTQSEPQWVWSTFEHVKNAPDQSHPVPGTSYNYYRPSCTDCNEVNQAPPLPWNIHAEPMHDHSLGSQIMRTTSIRSSSTVLNDKVRSQVLDGTVWSNYQLISTQWPTDGQDDSNLSHPGPAPTAPSWCNALNRLNREGTPFPAFLANTTLETYNQGTVPKVSSSCIGCHSRAGLAAAAPDNFSDFTYLLEIAQ